MKVPVLLLAGSLAVNAALLGLYKSRSFSHRSSNPASPSHSAAEAAQAQERKDKAIGSAAAAPAEDAELWSTASTAGFKTLVERLRAAGFPAHVIKVILRVQLDEYFTARKKALLGNNDVAPFWKNDPSFADPKTRSAMNELRREHSKIAKDLLGPDGDVISEGSQLYKARQYGHLDPAKIDQVERIRSDYSDLKQDIYAASSYSAQLPEDREKLAFLEKEQHDDLAKILTPEELLDYDLRNSQTANTLRNRLATFKPSEDEFRQIYQLQQALDQQLGTASVTSPEDYRQRQERQKEVDAQVKAILPPDRYQQYQIASDPQYGNFNRLAARFDLPPQTAIDVVSLQKDVMQRATAVRTNQDLTSADRNQQLAALAQEANTKLSQTLGSQAYQAYQEVNGQWLQNLQPRPVRTPPPVPAPKS